MRAAAKIFFVVTLLGVVAVARAQFGSPYDPSWTRHFRVGVLGGFNVKGDFQLGGTFGVAGNTAAAVGDPARDHEFDNGYVRVDDTGNAGGLTGYWGYQDAAQYDEATSSLFMNDSTSFSSAGGGSATADPAVGFDLAYGWMLKRWQHTRLGWEFGFGLLPLSLTDSRPYAAVANRDTYRFDTGGIIMPLAPYNGGSSGLGPLIAASGTLVGSDTVPGILRGTRELESTLYMFRLGPTLYYDVSSYVGVAAGVGPAVALVTQKYHYNERLTFNDGSSAANRGGFSGSDVVYGGYVNATVFYHAEEGGDIYLSLQYMPLGSTTLSGPGRRASLDLGGQMQVAIGVSWPF